MQVVVIGCGRVGSRLANVLCQEGHDVVVIDRVEEAFSGLGSEFEGDMVLGTGIDEDVLRRAGIEQADACAAVTSDDNTNIMAAQVAKHVFRVPRVVARIYDPDRELIYHQLGLETVSTTNIGVGVIHNLIVTNGLTRRGAIGSGEVEMVDAMVHAGLAGKRVGELEVEGAFRIAAVTRGGKGLLATPDTVLNQGDIIVGAVATAEIKSAKAALGV